MKTLKFRAKGSDGKWFYVEGIIEICNFFNGIDGGQLDIDTIEQFVAAGNTTGGELYERVEI